MLEFVNIQSEVFYELESWRVVIDGGGIQNFIPREELQHLYRKECCIEEVTKASLLLSLFPKGSRIPVYSRNTTMDECELEKYLSPFIQALKLFKKREDDTSNLFNKKDS